MQQKRNARERDKNINSSNEELICSEPLASQTSDPVPTAKKPEIKFTEFKIPLVSNNPKTGQKLDYAIPKKDYGLLVGEERDPDDGQLYSYVFRCPNCENWRPHCGEGTPIAQLWSGRYTYKQNGSPYSPQRKAA